MLDCVPVLLGFAETQRAYGGRHCIQTYDDVAHCCNSHLAVNRVIFSWAMRIDANLCFWVGFERLSSHPVSARRRLKQNSRVS